MHNQISLLETMMTDAKQCEEVYLPGPYWQGYCSRVYKAIKKYGLNDFRNNAAISKGYADSVTFDPHELWIGNWKNNLIRSFVKLPLIKSRIIPSYLNLIQHQFNQMKFYREKYFNFTFGNWIRETLSNFNIPETCYPGTKETINIDGKEISLIYIDHLMRIYNFSQHIDFSKAKTVFEIGGGFGTNAHLLMSMYPNIKKYIYCDIQPILYVSTQYLKHFFKEDVYDYAKLRDKNTISFKDNSEREIFCIPPWLLNNVQADVDVFWNSASFQEMPVNTINKYIEFILKFSKNTSLATCLVIYEGGNPERTRTPSQLRDIFSKHFNVSEIKPIVESENIPPVYYMAQRDMQRAKR